ncbi:putative ribosome biogenesis GTPase RsgA [Mycoplasma sp. CAG:776]|nr:putative ribosome biogenesis GTPase RsgA [Mycoplasma sp. CAG:776]
MLKGMIVKNISDTYTVKVDSKLYDCKARGKFRNNGLTPLVGDWVEFDEVNCYILDIEKRKNSLLRPSISNVDIALIITSVKSPDLSLYLLDKQICNISLMGIEPVICFTKLDLLSEDEKKELVGIKSYYESIGYQIFTNERLDLLKEYLKGKIVVLTGQTGAGKSSLLNALDGSLKLKVGEISKALGRGKHTTRHTEFFMVDEILIADTPGFSALDLSSFSREEIRDSFVEFRQETCEFRDCMHIKEQNCEVKKRVKEGKIKQSRYDNYCLFVAK